MVLLGYAKMQHVFSISTVYVCQFSKTFCKYYHKYDTNSSFLFAFHDI